MTAASYVIRVQGHLDDHWSDWFGGFTVTRDSDGTSTLSGPIADQAQLYGALAGLRDIGATLLDVRATEPYGAENRVASVGRLCDDPSVTDVDAVRLVRTPLLTDRAPYAYAAVASDVRTLVFTAGACPLDEQGEVVAPGDVAAQAEQVMVNLRTALAAAGAQLTDVVKTTVYVAGTDRADLSTAWRIVSGHFGAHDAPSTLLGVTVLGYPGQLVEVEAIAALR